jgi:hypothetical protein
MKRWHIVLFFVAILAAASTGGKSGSDRDLACPQTAGRPTLSWD